MIAAFIPAMMLEVFTTYFLIKVYIQNLPIDLTVYIDLFLWNFVLVVPNFFVIAISDTTSKAGKVLINHIEKYANYSNDDSVFLRVLRVFNKFVQLS